MTALTPMSLTQPDWAERSRQAVWHPCTQMKVHERFPPRAIVAADGPWLIDDQGHRILDAVSSWWVNLFGHNFGPIREAIIDQLGKLDHIMLAGLTHPPVVELSERLADLTGLGHAFYASDGASATEIALKMSVHSWRNLGQPEKHQFIGLQGGYHGETAGALSVTDIPLFREAYAPLLRLSATLPSPDPRHATPGVSAEAHTQAAIDALAAYLAEHHTRTAALILEPLVQGATGMAMYAPDYLVAVRELCDRYAVHWIADEIAVGFGRTGTLFAHQQARRADGSGVKPDFICLSKGLTGGVLPLSAVLTTDAVYAAFYDDRTVHGFLHSHSYTGNPLACRAALAVLDTFAARDAEGHDVLSRNRVAAERFTQLTAPLRAHPRVKATRHLGMIWAWDIDTTEPTFAARYHRAALDAGLLLRPIGSTLYVMPPYVLTEADQRALADGLVRVLDQVLAEIDALPVSSVPNAIPAADAVRMA
ncbi:MAG: adenosylmethionine--8-amino-7-oxononanoate transaminase [Aquabacterium sp.]|jgi:adenosylmethionine-8-amino-7-oxononanoate aminotransferase|uniref:adenosylmethionine--8-amino-7-oxononanoate transaminase n=1 Tax=Aquabacterium sp. TaxID=1872578 RepID=UPI002A360FCB|nr:adenosylmethionine--8-amino-7-oxononanoate transaminase [Aquabacterium sp.]MDX9842825.1 adenosylmethionine--8-amino-7-oxononanoate transaminase [Aquabacterium sp.]